MYIIALVCFGNDHIVCLKNWRGRKYYDFHPVIIGLQNGLSDRKKSWEFFSNIDSTQN